MNGICDTFGCSNASDYHTYCRSCRAGVCCIDQCSNFAAKQGKCARHADHSAKRVTMHQIDEAIATYNEILQVTKTHPQYFTEQDLQKIQANGQFFKKR